LLGWNFGAVGLLNLGMATLGAALFLLAGDFVSRIKLREENPRRK